MNPTTPEEISAEVKKLQSQLDKIEDDCHKRASPLRKGIKELELLNAELQWGVRTGSIVRTKKGIFRVVEVDITWGLDRPWLWANPKLKNGEWGFAKRHLYGDWQVGE